MTAAPGTGFAPSLDFVETFAVMAERVMAVAGGCDLDAKVPGCPGWSTYDVLVHLGNVHAWAATIVETGESAPSQNDHPATHRNKAVADWYAGKAGDLYQVLRLVDPTSECWTFSSRHHTRGFWPRRQTHETLVHLVDLDQAAGRASSLPTNVCADGVAEVLEVMVPRMRDRGYPADLTAPVSLHLTDTGHAWTLTPTADGAPALTPDTVRGADLVQGPADVLLQMLWKRLPADAPGVSITGDRDRVLAFLASRLTP